MNRLLKFSLLLIPAGLLLWLATSTPSISKRIKLINEALAEKTFPQLTVAERRTLDSLLKTIAVASRSTDSFLVNVPLAEGAAATGKIYFMVTDPAQAALTYCTKGNAVYEARLKTIFLDISLLRPADWMLYEPRSGIQLTERDLPFLKVYLTFILLHELGHHQLRHGSGGFFDFQWNRHNTAFVKMEEEADDFAFLNFAPLLKLNRLLLESANDASDINVPDPSDIDRVAMALLSMGQSMVLSMQFGLSRYSPFYSDAAHPTYLDRTKSLVDRIIKKKQVHKDIVDRAIVLKKTIESFQLIPQHNNLTEVTVEEPILDIDYTEDSVKIVPTTSNGYYSLPFSKIDNGSTGKLNQIQLTKADFVQTRRDFDSSQQVVLFTLKDKKSYCLVKGTNRLYRFTLNQFIALPPSSFGHSFEPPVQVFSATSPGWGVLVTSDSLLTSISSEREVTKVSLLTLVGMIKNKYALKDVSLNRFNIVRNESNVGIFFSANDGNQEQYGAVLLEVPTLSVKSIILFNLPADFFATNKYGNKFDFGENAFFFTHDNKDTRFYITTTEKQHNANASWCLWQVHERAAPRFINRTDFLATKTANAKIMDLLDPYMYRNQTTNIGRNRFLMNWNADYVYLLDLDNQKARPIFYPGDENLEIRSGEDGSVIFFIQGTRRFYLERFPQ